LPNQFRRYEGCRLWTSWRKVANLTRIGAAQQEKAASASVASDSVRQGSTGREEPGVCAAGADPQSDTPRTLRTVTFVGGGLAVDVDSRIYITANEVDADEPAAGCRSVSVMAIAARKVIRHIKVFANHRQPPIRREHK
jgi:hypothetical protein